MPRTDPAPVRIAIVELVFGATLLLAGCAPEPVGPAASATPLKDAIERAFPGEDKPEGVRMLLSIANGEPIEASGWFGPCESRFSWEWLSSGFGDQATREIPPELFAGREQWFHTLDRNHDNLITASDLDWSDPDANKAVEKSELERLLTGQIDLGRDPAGTPMKEAYLRGLFAGDLGSFVVGPPVDGRAPEFGLRTHDGTQFLRLSDFLGEKPVVLVFGNYTCDPFRADYAGVEEVYERYRDDANFLFVYVREAHPADGWVSHLNEAEGIKVAQPKTYDERAALAIQCGDALETSMPMLVDEIGDPVGHAYSGMPSRLYVIDRHGFVAYKSGRGPVGFKPFEMEQALVLTLLEQWGLAGEFPDG